MARVCGIYTSTDHYSDVCPSLLEPKTGDHSKDYAANIYNNRPPYQQQHYDPPPSSTYNPDSRLSERISPGREMAHLGSGKLGDTEGSSPEQDLARLGDG
ncbi:hypothetical protein Lal_00049302 [Lupinus albus]|nr:hypothetical protein Lal_00049302 [Lupinus albus]